MPRLPSRPQVRRIDRLIDGIGDRIRSRIFLVGVGRMAATVLAVIALAGGGWWMTRPATVAPPATGTVPDVAPAFTLVPPVVSEIVVHVVGAVVRPGVYGLDPGARVIDAVEVAGGPRPEAVLDAINLAAAVSDGQRIRVPTIDDPPMIDVSGDMTTGEVATVATVDVNSAGVAALDELPGVGPALAAAIVGHRERHGPFESVDDLLAVSGIGPAKLDVLRPLITIGGAP